MVAIIRAALTGENTTSHPADKVTIPLRPTPQVVATVRNRPKSAKVSALE